LASGTLRSLIAGPLTEAEFNLSIADVHPLMGEWHLDKISFVLSESILLEILAIPFSLNPSADDVIIWAFSSSGNFSLQSAYLLAKGLDPLEPTSMYESSWIWKARTSPRIKFFLWLCFHQSLPTCEVLGNRGINIFQGCSMCTSSMESIIHVLRDCPRGSGFLVEIGHFREC
jgi:hypothetical protein